MCDNAIIIRKAREGDGNGTAPRLGVLKPRVENLPVIQNARVRLLDAIRALERADGAKAEDHASVHAVEEQRRISRGGLSMTVLPNAIILLNENPEDATAKRALQIVSEHGTSEEIRLAAKILLDS